MSYKVMTSVPAEMKQGIRIIYRSSRSKDGGTAQREIEVCVSYEPAEFDKIVANMVDNLRKNERIYASLVPRCFVRGQKEFARRKLDADYGHDTHEFYAHIERQWRRSLGASPDREHNKFLLDLDTPEEIAAFHLLEKSPYCPYELMPMSDRWVYKSKNGLHVVCKPFNLNLLPHILLSKVVRDGMFLVCYTQEGQP